MKRGIKIFGLLILILCLGLVAYTSITFAASCGGLNEPCCITAKNPCNSGLTCQSNICVASSVIPVTPTTPLTPPTEPSRYYCEVVPSNQCPKANTVMNLSGLTNAHGYKTGSMPYSLCCNFNGSSSCGTGDTVMYLSSTSNAHAEMPKFDSSCVSKMQFSAQPVVCSSYTTQTTCDSHSQCWWEDRWLLLDRCLDTPACSTLDLQECSNRDDCGIHLTPLTQDYTTSVCLAKDMKCIGVNNPALNACPGAEDDEGYVYDIEVASLSGETNAHIGNFSDYPVKICCSEFCEMYKRNDSCWAEPAKKCTWTPGRTKIYPNAGCCGEEYLWRPDLNPPQCQETAWDECYNIWAPTSEGQKDAPEGEASVFPMGKPWSKYCEKISEGLSYGQKVNVKKYPE